MAEKGLIDRFKEFDAYPKVLDDFRIKTYTGALVTSLSAVIMGMLFVAELRHYLKTDVHAELLVDTTRPEKLKINLDVFFPRLGCAYITIDAMDVSGDVQSDFDHGVFKKRYDKNGQPINVNASKEDLDVKKDDLHGALNDSLCLSCFGAETDDQPCCNTCEDVKKAYNKFGWTLNLHDVDTDNITQCEGEKWKGDLEEQLDEGCQVYGFIEVSKVAGRFLIAPDKRFQQQPRMLFNFIGIGKDGRITMNLDDLFGNGRKKHNMTHTIRSLSFGAPIPGVANPLDGTQGIVANTSVRGESKTFQYFTKIVPTWYKTLGGEVVQSNQYSVTKQTQVVRGAAGEIGPGILVRYELSPLLIQYTETRRSLWSFLTNVCAIIGGIFTVASLIDCVFYRTFKTFYNKFDFGMKG